MDKRVKRLWVAALQSGEYQQTQEKLRRMEPALRGDRTINPGYCCLGVLCELYRQDTGSGQWDERGWFVGEDFPAEAAFPPKIVYEWAGLPREVSITLVINSARDTAAGHNDKGRTFAQIANAIEEQL